MPLRVPANVLLRADCLYNSKTARIALFAAQIAATGSLFAASIDQLPFASPHIGHADSPTARAWIWSAACSLSADGISCDSFSPRAGRRRRAGGAAGSTSAACRHWGAGRGTSLAPFLLCLLSFFLLFSHLATWQPRPGPPPAPLPNRAAGLRGHSFAAGRHMPASPAPQAPGPPGPL